MFKKMRRRLALYYAAVMAAFFILLSFGAYESLEWSITSEQEREVLLFAEEEAHEHAILFQHREILTSQPEDKGGSGRMYYYAFDGEGILVNSVPAAGEFAGRVLERIRSWDVAAGDVALLDFGGQNGKMMMAAMPIVYEGNPLGMVYVGRDVTAVYRGLERLMMTLGAFSLLALVLATLAGYLMAGRAILPLKEAYERQRRFAADASHELRTPLSVILSSVDVLQADHRECSPFIRQTIEDMRDEIKKMAKLVGDLLMIARSDQTELAVMKERFNLTVVTEQVIRKMQPVAERKNIRLDFPRGHVVEVCADAERMQQLLLILVDNAVKYTPQGGFVTVSLECNHEARKVKIMVNDTGIGVPEADRERIFDRFYRVDKARSRQSGGSGLGLAIAKGIVDMHRGEIKVESAAGSGASFIVVVPE